MKSPTPALPQGEGAAYRNLYDSSFKEERNLYNVCVLKRPIEKVFSASPSLRGRAGVGLFCLLLFGCLTDFEPREIDQARDILVVEGVITDDETTITLTRSINLTDYESSEPKYIYDAHVYVECDDGAQFHAYNWNGKYKINSGKLNPERKYRLRIEIEENDCDRLNNKISLGSPCPVKTYLYGTEYSYPIQTPEIDSVFWTKRGNGQPVIIHVATHSPYEEILYYRWWFNEDWEINSPVPLDGYPSHCWNYNISSEIFLGSAEKTIFGKLADNIIEIPAWSKKISGLYRIVVWQNAISKQAYDYFTNIKKNSETMGTIFAPIPSELRGNIICITDPERHAIGFVEVSSTKTGQRNIYSREVYERPVGECPFFSLLEIDKGERYDYIQISNDEDVYVHRSCVDCTYHGATTDKPDNWPR